MVDHATRAEFPRHGHVQGLPAVAAPIGLAAGIGSFAYLWTTGGSEPYLAVSAAIAAASVPGTVRHAGRMRSWMVRERLPRCLRDRGCDCVYACRKDAMSDIAEVLLLSVERKTGRFYLLAASARDFLDFRYQLPDGSYLFSSLREGLNDPESLVEGTFLILDFDSQEAQRRAGFEQGPQTIAELKVSYDSYVNAFGPNPRIRLGLYKLRPWIFALLTEQVAFVQRYLSAPPPLWRGGCFGDLLEVGRYPSGTIGYDYVQGEVLSLAADAAVHWV